MDFSHYSDEAVQAAAALVNSRGSVTGTEYLGTVGEARTFLQKHSLFEEVPITSADIAELQAARSRLHDVFHAEDEKEAARVLNALLRDLDIEPYLTDHDGAWHMHYVPEEASYGRRVAATTAMGLALTIGHYGFGRLGVCAADDCADVFVDMSRNRSRRYCADGCSSRANVAAYRARHKAKSS